MKIKRKQNDGNGKDDTESRRKTTDGEDGTKIEIWREDLRGNRRVVQVQVPPLLHP